MAEYDDSPPTHRWVHVGYALTEDRRLDRDRILNPHPELLPADEAKRIVTNNHGRYATDDEIAAAEQAQRDEAPSEAPAEAAVETATEAKADEGRADTPPITPPEVPAAGPAKAVPKSPKAGGWGAQAVGETTTTSTKSGE